MKKKASLSLSVNAIVVLILAITMLGLGLTFIRSMFGSASGKLGEVITGAKLENPATADNPVTMPAELTIRRGDTKQVEISFYNTRTNTVQKADFDITECKDSDGNEMGITTTIADTDPDTDGDQPGTSTTPELPTITAPQQDAPPSKAIGYKAIIKIEKGVDTGNFICSLDVNENGATAPYACGDDADEICETKQFFLNVVS